MRQPDRRCASRVTDAGGRGLRFEAADAPFEFQALPWTAFGWRTRRNLRDLPPIHRAIVRIASWQMGVGGDDEQGTPVAEDVAASRPAAPATCVSP